MTPAILLPARIIPARAGFTGGRAPRAQGGRDHPRSRGVYKAVADITDTIDGSSPLARGLPRDLSPPAQLGRIIPARAGFTRRGVLPVRPRRDHPRSRGVYAAPDSSTRSWAGSSPLARGLRRAGQLNKIMGGIIPARAGFTVDAIRSAYPYRDHPRSRGVYARRVSPSQPITGSSPLARGLRGVLRRSLAPEGIIPARAGFTRSRS